MEISRILRKRQTGFSLEFFPPKTRDGNAQLLKVVKQFMEYVPMFASVTCGAGGSTQSQQRTKETVLQLLKKTDLITVMAHLTSIGMTRESMDALLRDYLKNGIDNILALRGDPPQDRADFDFSKGEFVHARDLVEFIKPYKRFSVGVALYPEGHPEAPGLDRDIDYAKSKIDAGADFGITQMFFDNKYLYDFMEKAWKKGIRIPILPGIMPITNFAKIKKFASSCNATIPIWIEERMSRISDNPDEMFKIGTDIAIEQCEDLLTNGVRFFHFYTLNRFEAVARILDGISGDVFPLNRTLEVRGS